MTDYKQNMAGLSSAEAKKLQDRYGKNELTPRRQESFLKKIFHIICEPMFLLLIVAAVIYFILGESVQTLTTITIPCERRYYYA
jgi:Ca2+-transporting ATPase